MDLTPKTLKGAFIDLEPITEAHREGLRAAATADDSIYDYMPMDIAGEYDAWFDDSLARHASGEAVVYIVRNKADNRLVGSSSYLDISPRDAHVEIGYTWYTPDVHGTTVNPEAKLLLLSNAFATLNCVRVQLKADERNARSRRAMEKMGAKFEGVLRRNYKVQHDFIRNTAFYSVLDDEWPEVKAGLMARLVKFKPESEPNTKPNTKDV